MNKFNKIIFWCEFPKKLNPKNISLIDFDTEVYIAAKNVKEFNYWKKEFKKKNIHFGVWPILSFKAGYWFSKYTKIKDINKLKEFNGIDMKIDLEPPIPYKSSLFKKFSIFSLIKDGKKELKNHGENNARYLQETINSLVSKKVIISGFPFPNFINKTYGDDYRKFEERLYRNHFLYITFFRNKLLRKIIMLYYHFYVKSKLRLYKNTPNKLYFAIGCLGTGVFSTEPVYENLKDFERDLDVFSKWGVKNLVVFNLEGILNKKDSYLWINALKKRLKQ